MADDFPASFGRPAGAQIPAGEEGFDGHYGAEDVFVVQCGGVKEFDLRRARAGLDLTRTVLPPRLDLYAMTEGPEAHCVLVAGDWLYITAGWRHKVWAVSPSFHFSVGVLSPK